VHGLRERKGKKITRKKKKRVMLALLSTTRHLLLFFLLFGFYFGKLDWQFITRRGRGIRQGPDPLIISSGGGIHMMTLYGLHSEKKRMTFSYMDRTLLAAAAAAAVCRDIAHRIDIDALLSIK
jgi:hypothetical protein